MKLPIKQISLITAFFLLTVCSIYYFAVSTKPSKQPEKIPVLETKPDKPIDQDISSISQTVMPSLPEPDTSVLAPDSVNLQAVPILYYHSIAFQPGNEVRIPIDKFQEHMSYLSEEGYQVISMDELYECLYDGKPFPSKPVVITFDDGYSDNFTNAFPIMEKYGFTATVFMTSSYIDQSDALSSEQLRILQNAGWIVGGHTENHTDLTKVSTAQTVTELQESRKTIEAITGKPLKYFAYPYGGYNSEVMNEVRNDGNSLAFTTDRGWVSKTSNPFAMHRVYCYASMSMDEFIRRISNPNY